MIYVAVGAIISASAIQISTSIISLHFLFIIWFIYRKKSFQFILFYLLISLVFYYHTHLKTDFSHQETFTESDFIWTSTYTINGQYIRGFATTPEGEKWYINYKFLSEREKQHFQLQSLAGSSFHFTGKNMQQRIPAHEFAFDMSTYIKSHGAVGMFSVNTWRQLTGSEGTIGFLANHRY